MNNERVVRKPRHALAWFLSVLAGGALMTALAVFFVWQRYQYVQLGRQVARLQAQETLLRQVIEPLEVEVDYLSRPERVEDIARSRLGMRQPEPDHVYRLDIHVSRNASVSP